MPVYGAICLYQFSNVLLVRGRVSQKWSFPKGHSNAGEPPIECAKRELYEEAGIRFDGKECGYYTMKGGSYFVFHINFLCFLRVYDTVEIDEVAWWPLSDLPRRTNIDVSIFKSHLRTLPNALHKNYSYSEDSNDRIKEILDRLS